MNERHTLSIEEVENFLSEAMDELPQEMFNGLNGGVVLVASVVRSPHGNGLFTLGTYHNEQYGMGRYIKINYGSFVRVHGKKSVETQKEELRKLLRHELTHHVESLAGVRMLEDKDAQFIENFKAKKHKKDK